MQQLQGSKVLVGVALLAAVMALDLCHYALQLGHLLLLAGHRALQGSLYPLQRFARRIK
jgi:hypothetical protein